MSVSKVMTLGFVGGLGFYAAEQVWLWLGGLVGLCYG